VSRIHRTVIAALLATAGAALAQQPRSAVEEIERYRAALGDGNPAELWEARGEAMWKEKRGPKNVSLERCDLGLGPGIVKGAYTVLPKYFHDSGKVQDLESRLVTCMTTLQGIAEAEAKKDHFGDGPKRSVMEALVAWITRHEDERVAVASQGARSLRDRQADVLLSGRSVRFLLRHVPFA
jgi:sulfur-oxidizing protein SoxA